MFLPHKDPLKVITIFIHLEKNLHENAWTDPRIPSTKKKKKKIKLFYLNK